MFEKEQIFIVVRVDIRSGVKDIISAYRNEHDAQNLVYKLDRISRRRGDGRTIHGVIVKDLVGEAE